MKELIEKMREALLETFPDMYAPDNIDEDSIRICAEIAAAHYENKWVRVDSGVLPPEAQFAKGISVDLYIYAGRIIEGYYYFKDKEWCDDEGDGITGVTHYIIKQYPTPPNSDKNVKECDATKAQ